MKKFVTMMMAVAMLFTLAVPVFAAGSDPTKDISDTEVKITFNEPTIEVTIPADVALTLDPNLVDNGSKGRQVYSTEGEIENTGNVSLYVSFKDCMVTVPTGVTAVSTYVRPTMKEQQIFLYITAEEEKTTIPAYDPEDEASVYYVRGLNQLALTTDAVAKPNVLLVDTTATGKKGYLQIGGNMTPNPEIPWSKGGGDGDISVDLKYIFATTSDVRAVPAP